MTRINVNFEVKEQQLVWLKEQPLRAKDENYFYAVFKLCEKWKDVAGIKAAFFRDDELPYVIDLVESQEVEGCLECVIPWEVMAEKGEFYIGVFGGERILTNKARVDVGDSCYCGGGLPSTPTYDWFREVEQQLEDLDNIANPLPVGGNAGQVLVKDTADDYAVKWEDVKDYSQDIKTIEQAVIELEEEKADKTEIPTKVSQLENDESFATETYVDEAIEAIPPVDLSNYALKTDIPSTTGLATEEYVDDKIAAIPETDLTDYYTKAEVDETLTGYLPTAGGEVGSLDIKYGINMNFNRLENTGAIVLRESKDFKGITIHQNIINEGDLRAYYSVEDEETGIISNYPLECTQPESLANKKYVDEAIETAKPDLTGYATEKYVDEKIQNIDIPDTDLTNYYTKTEVNNALNDKANKTDIPTIPTNISAFNNDVGYLKEHQSLANYYTKTEVDNAIANAEVDVDLSNYYTKTEIDGFLGDINTLLDDINGESPEAIALVDEINGEVI